MFIATLVAKGTLERDTVRAAQDAVDAAGLIQGEWRWIDEGKAGDIPAGEHPADSAALRAALEGKLGEVDVIVQSAAERERKLLVADMDSTMITVECIDELADYAGIKPQIAEVTERAMRGELDFEGALKSRVALLKGLPEAAIEQCLAERVRIMPGAKALVRTFRARGGTAILVSGGFTRFAVPVAAEIGFDRVVANRLSIAHGLLDGTVAEPIVGASAKLDTLEGSLRELELGRAAALAIGDGANDIPMIRAAGLGIAYRAKPATRAAAAAAIDHGDLGAVLYAMGIPRAQWVSG